MDYFVRQFYRPDIQTAGVITTDRLCDACRGINIQTLSAAVAYRHSLSYRTLVERKKSCPLCDTIATGLGWHPAYHLPGAVSEPLFLRLYKNAVDIHIDVRCATRAEPTAEPLTIPLRLPLLTIEGDVAESHPFWLPGVRLLSNTASDQSYQTIIGWIRECVTTHDCSHPIWQTPPDLFRLAESFGLWTDDRYEPPVDDMLQKRPGRLIDLNAFDRGNQDARLVNGDDTSAHYIALSHCWGSDISARYCTTTENMGSRASRIVYSELNRTFQDAFTITRAIGFRYLWIDSICIIQNSKSDWESEAAKMGSVYSNAFLTIAADASKDGHGGCFNHKSRNQLDKFKLFKIDGTLDDGRPSTLYVHDDSVGNHIPFGITRSSLAERAWTYQEQILSRRILHYTHEQLFWECRKGYKAEDNLSIWSERPRTKYASSCGTIQRLRMSVGYETIDRVRSKDDFKDLAVKMGNDNVLMLDGQPFYAAPKRQLLIHWYYNMVAEEFGTRKLTFDSDKLPALSGIARAFNQDLGSEYLAGTRLLGLELGLCWYRQGPVAAKPAHYRAPSFSWASQDSHVHWPETLQDKIGSDHSSHLRLEGYDIQRTSDTYGAVSGGWLKVTGCMREATFPVSEQLNEN